MLGDGVGGHSLETVIVEDEALGYLQRMLRSFDVNEDTLAFESIKEAGIGGNFMASEHTVRHMRDGIWRGKGIFVNDDFDAWRVAGAKNTAERAHARLQNILARHMPLEPVLPAGVVDALRALTREATDELRGKS